MSGQTKIELLLEFKDRATTGITKARDTINSRVKEMKNDLSSFKEHSIKSFTNMKGDISGFITSLKQVKLPDSIKKTSDTMQGHFQKSIAAIRNEIPSIDNAIKLIGNPFAMLAKGVNLLKEGFSKMISSAADFQTKFLQIENLNMDKSKESMQAYEKSVHDAAMTIGTDLGKTSDAFYTMQTTTKSTGKALENLVNPVLKFSRATGTDLKANMDLASKSVKAFKLETKGAEAYMKSSFKTIQMTGLSYSDLAKNQMKFKDATIESSQSIDNANKMFTAFKSITGDASKASEMTKTALLGLKDKSVSEGLAKMGIILEDGKGNARDYSSIIQDVNTHFKNMSPEAIKKTISKIGGSGGLSELFMKLNGESKQFNETINNFDASKFDMDEAFERAMGSYNELKDMVGNRFSTLMSILGKGILPIVSSALESINKGLLWVYGNLDKIYEVLEWVKIGLISAAIGIVAWGLTWAALNASVVASTISLYAWVAGQEILNAGTKILSASQAALNMVLNANPIAIVVGVIAALVAGMIMAYKKSEKFRAIIDGLWASMKAFGLYIKDSFVGIFKGAWAGIKGFFSNIWSGVKNLVSGIADAFGGIGKIIKSVFTFNWDGVKEGVSDLKGGLKRAGGGLLDAVPLTSVVKNYKQLGNAAKDGFNEGVKNRKDVNLKDEFNKGHLNSLLESKGLLKADGSRDMAQIEKLNLLKTGKKIDEEKLKAYKQPEEKENKEIEKPLIPDTTQLQTKSPEKASVPVSFTGMGTTSAATKSVSIHVDSFVKGGINMLNGEGDGLSLSEIEDRFNEMFTRMLRRVETAQ